MSFANAALSGRHWNVWPGPSLPGNAPLLVHGTDWPAAFTYGTVSRSIAGSILSARAVFAPDIEASSTAATAMAGRDRMRWAAPSSA